MPPLKIPLQKSCPQCLKDYGTLLRPPFNSTIPVYNTAYRHIWHSRMHLRLHMSESSNPQSKTFPVLPCQQLPQVPSHREPHCIIYWHWANQANMCINSCIRFMDHSQSSPNALDVGRRAGTKWNSRQQTVESRFLRRDSQPFHLVCSCMQCIGTPKVHVTCDISTNELSRSSMNMKKRTRFQLLTTSLPAGII